MVTKATRERLERLAAVVAASGAHGRWLVLTHDNPDPDALTAARLLALLLESHFRRRTTCAYGGLVGRAENRAMVRVLRLRFSELRRLDLGRFRHFALVDTQPDTGNNQLPRGVTPDLVFDHHPVRRGTRVAAFADVRPAYGATATILAEYLAAAGIEPSRTCATAIAYAIRSETQDFAREYSPVDKAVYDRCLAHVDKRALGRIQNAPLPRGYFRYLQQALAALEGVGSLVATHLGEIDQPDIVPEIADLLLRMEGKTWSLCTGRRNGRVYLSIRTTNPRADAGRLIRSIIGAAGKGGGHGQTAGGWVAAGSAQAGDPAAVQRLLSRRLARRLRKDPDRIAPIELGA